MNIFNLALLELQREKAEINLSNLLDRAIRIREYLDLKSKN